MLRPTTKRKSESAVSLTKQRKISHSPSPDPEHHSDNDFFVQDPPVAAKHVKKHARKSEPAPKTRVDEEYDEDVGRTESQTFLALVEFESKKKRKMNKENKGYMEKFEKSVASAEGKLKLALAEEEQRSSTSDALFLESFRAAYGASRSQASAKDNATSSSPTQGFAAMYKKSKDIASTAFALIAKFEEVAQRISTLDTAAMIENEWGEQDAAFAGLLLDGKRLGIERYRHMLTARKKQRVEGEDGDTDKLFFEKEQNKVDGGWGKVVKKQEKALKKLVKTIDIVEEDD